MPGDQTQVIGGHDMILYVAPWSSGLVAPVNTVAWGTAWGTTWVDRGYTRDGLRFRLNVTRQLVQVDQVVDPVLRIPTARDVTMGSRMAQITGLAVQQATGQGYATTPTPAPATAGADKLDFNGLIQDQYIGIGFDVRTPGAVQAVRVIGWKGLPTGNTEINFTTNDAATIQFEVGLVPDTDNLTGTPTAPRIATFIDIYVPTGGA